MKVFQSLAHVRASRRSSVSSQLTEYSYCGVVALLILPHVRPREAVLCELVEGRFLRSGSEARPYDGNACSYKRRRRWSEPYSPSDTADGQVAE